MASVADLANIWQQLCAELSDAAAEAAAIDGGVEAGLGVAVDAGAVILVGADPPGDLVALVVAGVFLIIALGFKWIVAYPIGWVLGKIPFVGGTLQGWVQGVGDWEWNLVSGAAYAAFNFLIGCIVNFFRVAIGVVEYPAKLAWNVYAKVWWVINVFVPNTINNVLGYINNVGYQADSYALSLVQNLTNYVQALYNAAIHHTDESVNALDLKTQAEFNTAINHANDLYNQGVNNLQGAVQQLNTTIGDDVQSIELQIGHAATEAEQFASTLVGAVENHLLEVIAAGVATATAVADGIGNNLNKYLDECGEPVCQAHGQNAKNVNTLGTLGTTAAFLAFLYEAIKNPIPTADISAEVLEPVAGLAGGLLDSLVGAVV